jgi:hypothetical protein
MRRITDDRLIKVTDVDIDSAFQVTRGPQVARMAVSTDPDWRAAGQSPALLAMQPFVKLRGVASHKGVRRSRHLQIAKLGK